MVFGFLKKQFIDVIEWTEPEDGILAFKYPMEDNEIQNGAVLTVRESQRAIFVDEGKLADSFGPGRYKLTTQTLPVLTNLRNWDKLFSSPFKSDLYFFSTREQTDRKWGTAQPITLRDPEMGAIRLRAFGAYSYELRDPALFHKTLSGTREIYRASDIDGQLRAAVTTGIASFLGGSKKAFIEMAADQQAFSEILQQSLAPQFERYGLMLKTFFVQSISLPEELQPYFDKAASMRMLGDLGTYMQFQTAEAMMAAAKNEGGGAAGAGVGMGAGLAMGQAMAQSMANSGGGASAQAEDPLATIDRLHEMMKKGILSEAEFNAKKTELMKRVK